MYLTSNFENKMLFLYAITCIVLSSCYGQEWVDPYEMASSSDQSSQSTMKWHNERVLEAQSKNSCTDTICISYYKRLVNVLLKSATRKSVDKFAYEGKLFIEIPTENYDVLKEFASSSGDVQMLQKIDDILSSVLLAPSSQTSNRLAEALESWSDYLYIRFYNTESLIVVSCIFVLSLSYKLLRANLTIGSVFKYLILLGWIIDFSFRWMSLLQEAEINNMVAMKKFGSVPPDCDPKTLSTWKYIVSFFSTSDNCKEYHHVIYKDQFYSVSPLVVFSHQLGIVIYTPAASIGEALGSFTSGILTHLPWGVNVILLPLLLVFSAIIICIALTFWTGTSFGVNIFGIFKFNFGNSNHLHHGAARDAISGDNLSTLLNNLTQRNMIEEVRPTPHTSSVINSEECNCSKKKVKTVEVEKSECLELTTDILEIKDETEMKENLIHDGSGDSK